MKSSVAARLILVAPIASAALAQELTSLHKPCETHMNARNTVECYLPESNTLLKCDTSLGQPRPQCLTGDGFFADCVYRKMAPGVPPMIYCSVDAAAPPTDPSAPPRIVITDERFGGPREVVRVPRGTPRPNVASVQPNNEESFDELVRECREAWNRMTVQATQSPKNPGGTIASMTRFMERACTPEPSVIRDATQRRSHCDTVTGYVESLVAQSAAQSDAVRRDLRRVLMGACSK